MTSLSPLYTAEAEEESYQIVQSWHKSRKAKDLLSRVDMLERLSDSAAGHDIDIGERLGELIRETEDELSDLREEAISEAVSTWPTEDYDIDGHLDGFALSVQDALREARRQHLSDVIIERRLAA